MSKARTRRGARYRLGELIGRGRLADVYRAWDRDRNRSVAIKWVREGVDPSLFPRWRADGDELRRLSHPGLVRERDHGTQDGRPYLVMDLASPTTLRDFCASNPLTPDAVDAVARQLAGTLGYLHDNDLAHRHVSSDSIYVKQVGPVGSIRTWLDCGPWASSQLPPLDELAPELRRGEESSAAGDIWALGKVILECLSGEAASEPPAATSAPRLPHDLLEPWATLLPMMLDERAQYRPTGGQVAAIVTATHTRLAVQRQADVVVQTEPTRRVGLTSWKPAAGPRSWTRATALTSVAAGAAIVLVVVGVRVVRAADDQTPRMDAAPAPAQLVDGGDRSAKPATRGTSASVTTPTFRTVAVVTALGPGSPGHVGGRLAHAHTSHRGGGGGQHHPSMAGGVGRANGHTATRVLPAPRGPKTAQAHSAVTRRTSANR